MSDLKTVCFDSTCMNVPHYTAGEGIDITNEVISAPAIAELEAFLGIPDEDVLGVQVDYENKTFKRLSGAKELSAGTDFDQFAMYGGRKRCNVADDGTINAYYGDAGYVEDGSNGQVMVYQPKFYYRTVPVKLEKQTTRKGYHLRKANYYVSENPKPGFKLHPAFYDANGNEIDYYLYSAFEGSLYDASASAYLADDEQVMDVNADKFSSVGGVRPASGLTQNLTGLNMEQLSQNRGTNWHLDGIKTASAELYLMIVELGGLNFQTLIGQGVVSIPDVNTENCASYTGSTVGNGTGQASSTKNHLGVEETASGHVSISYRGVENSYGNIWKNVIGATIYGDGNLNGGEPYICEDFNYADTLTANYKPAGFTMTNTNGYISAFGYSEEYDWLFMASETLGNSALPVGDYTYVSANLNGLRSSLLGGYWTTGAFAGGFYWNVTTGVGARDRAIGGRLVYIPTA